MDFRSLWRRFTIRPDSRSGALPLALVLVIGIGSLAALLAAASRFSRMQRVPLRSDATFTPRDFSAAQTVWKVQGLTNARFANGVIEVPADEASRYRDAWKPDGEVDDKTRWADVWQQANDRLSQFSGARERDAAREISRAQVVSRLLEELPDIETADIVWDEAAANGWRAPEQARATVYLQAAPGCSLGPDIIDAVRKAVSGSKAHLAPEDVTIMDQTRMVAYGGTDVSTAAIHAAQVASQFRDRLADDLDHISGVTVRVHLLSTEATEAMRTPVAVSVGIPEVTVRTLAQLEGEVPVAAADSAAARIRRHVFKSVEQHLHQLIRAKVSQLLPSELALASAEQLVVQTIPAPPSVHPPVQPVFEAGVSAWLERHGLGLIAVLLGICAASMLRPRRRDSSPDPATDDVQAAAGGDGPATPPAAVAHRDKEPPLPFRAVEDNGVGSNHAAIDQSRMSQPEHDVGVTAKVASTPETVPTALAITNPSAVPAADPTERASVTTPPAPPHEAHLLRDVLSRLEATRERASQSARATTARERDQKTSGPHVLHGRVTGAAAAQVTGFDLESLADESPERWREIASQIELTTWTRALFGASDKLRNRLQEHLAPADAARLSAELQSNRPVRLRDIDAAQHEVQAVYEELRQQLPLQRSIPPRAAPPLRAA